MKKILQDEKSIPKAFNNCLIDVTHSFGLKKKNVGLEDTLSKILKSSKNFESLKKIKESQQAAANSSFSFKVISEDEGEIPLKTLPINKSTISGDIPTKILK